MNNTLSTKKISAKLSLLAAGLLAAAGASLSTPVLGADIYLTIEGVPGESKSWFDPTSWRGGQLPGPNDNVVLEGNNYLVLDQNLNRSGAPVQFANLTVRGSSTFEVLHGAIVKTRDQIQYDNGRIIFRSSGDIGDSLIAGEHSSGTASNGSNGDNDSGVVILNPNQKSKRIIVLKSSATVDVGLGGIVPASLTQTSTGALELHAGAGHYSTITTETALLDGDLKLSLYYGFEPVAGDQFKIVTINGRQSGQFVGLPEGGYVGCTDRNICLRISYRGGDGNDIVLSADAVDPGVALLLPSVQTAREPARFRP